MAIAINYERATGLVATLLALVGLGVGEALEGAVGSAALRNLAEAGGARLRDLVHRHHALGGAFNAEEVLFRAGDSVARKLVRRQNRLVATARRRCQKSQVRPSGHT